MIDVLVIGAGIVGSWIARTAARAGLSVVVAEKSSRPGDGITARNSGVLHAGLYYAPDSLKAYHCVRGRALTEEYLRGSLVPYQICGKLVVAGRSSETSASVAAEREGDLHRLYENAKASGAENIEMIAHPGREFPGVRGTVALNSRGTGIVDVPLYWERVRQEAEEAGAFFLYRRQCTSYGGSRGTSHSAVLTGDDGSTEEIETAWIVNAAGLESARTAAVFGLAAYEIRPNRGEYYRLARPLSYSKLVYPLPGHAGHLGVHYTFNAAGEAYAGPSSVPAENDSDYRITTSRAVFHESLTEILDGYEEADLQPGYAGLRPRLYRSGAHIKDFVIEESPTRIIHLLGIESPGLTSSPSLAETVVQKIKKES